MRTFELHRNTDVSGISGTGFVAEGVVFKDGTTVVRWLNREHPSTNVYNSAGYPSVNSQTLADFVEWCQE